MYISVGHHHGIRSADTIFISQDVVPRADRGIAFANVDVAGFAIEVAELAVRHLYHIGCPHHFGDRPVHDDVLPVDEILAYPHLCRAVAVACSVSSGIQIVGIAKLPDGRVGEITWNEGVGIPWFIPSCAHYGRRCVLSRSLLGLSQHGV